MLDTRYFNLYFACCNPRLCQRFGVQRHGRRLEWRVVIALHAHDANNGRLDRGEAMDHLLQVRVQLISLRSNQLGKPCRYGFRVDGEVKADFVSRRAEQFRAVATFLE
ncbi:hypothetical protein D3C84_897540 [compost metagenome]